MKYYTKRRKIRIRPYILVIISIIIVFNLFIYFFEKRVFPTALQISETMVKAKTVEIISETSIALFNEEFSYDEMVTIDKDSNNNINLMQVNTVKLNYLTSQLSVQCNEKLQEMGQIGVKVPLGWITENSILYNLGPSITVKIEPIGNMNVSYESKFESAGINQTRHKIYLNVETKVRTMVPFHSQELDVTCQIPIAENIIVGQTPSTAIDFGQNNK
ncbi:sporulation protein YunB [Clostridium paraputrificum]|uniref:sporulation protein YunB n=1 Tax=Clostridium TaxID=1485 RepID=UPI003D33EBF7